jgi:hypothetical protein
VCGGGGVQKGKLLFVWGEGDAESFYCVCVLEGGTGTARTREEQEETLLIRYFCRGNPDTSAAHLPTVCDILLWDLLYFNEIFTHSMSNLPSKLTIGQQLLYILGDGLGQKAGGLHCKPGEAYMRLITASCEAGRGQCTCVHSTSVYVL